MKSLQFTILALLSVFFTPLAFGLTEEGNSFGGCVGSAANGSPVPDDSKGIRPIGAVTDAPVEEGKTVISEEDEVENNVKAGDVPPVEPEDVPATTVA